MRKLGFVILVIVVVLIILCNYKPEKTVVSTEKEPQIEANDRVEFVSINITYDQSLGRNVLAEVQTAVAMFPPEVIKAFVADDWKIAIVSEIDLTGTPFEAETYPATVGLTNFGSKTIQVAPTKDSPDDFITIKTLHEMSHFAESYYGHAADTDKWQNLYEEYKDTYVEYEFSGVSTDLNNRVDVEYATTDRYEMFACAMKDFLREPEYLKEKYPDLFGYFTGLME